MTARITSSLALAVLLLTAPSARGDVLSDAANLCGLPSAVLSQSFNIDPVDPVGFDDCPKLCEKWRRICRNAVAKAGRCLKSAAGRVASLRKSECATLDDAAMRTACVDVIKTQQLSAKDFATSQVETNSGFCDGPGLADCLGDCN